MLEKTARRTIQNRVAAQEPVAPMAFLRAKPIGVMGMIDQGEQDDKVRVHHRLSLAIGAVD